MGFFIPMKTWGKKITRPTIGFIRAILEWIARNELSVLLALFALSASIWAFIELADTVMEGETQQFDNWAVQALRQADDPAVPIGPRWLSEVGRDVTALGGHTFLTLLTAAVTGFLWIRRIYADMLLVLAATIGGALLTAILKSSFDRPRPDLVPHLALTYTSSFPSGHAMLSATVFLTLGVLLGSFVRERVLQAYFLIVAVLLTVLVGMSRVYLGVHYPTDVLTGWVAGLAWAIACWLVARLLRKRHVIESDIAAKTEPGLAVENDTQ